MNAGGPDAPAEREGREGVEELTCKEVVELATEYLEGVLPPAGRARFEAHLAGCPGCRIYLDQLRKTTRVLGSLREEEAGLAPRTVEALRRVFEGWKGRQ
jgi:predicted anti-sigma-YlaC factor YlaD